MNTSFPEIKCGFVTNLEHGTDELKFVLLINFTISYGQGQHVFLQLLTLCIVSGQLGNTMDRVLDLKSGRPELES